PSPLLKPPIPVLVGAPRRLKIFDKTNSYPIIYGKEGFNKKFHRARSGAWRVWHRWPLMLGAWWGDFGEVVLERVLDGHALGWRTLDVDAAHHLVHGASRPNPRRRVW